MQALAFGGCLCVQCGLRGGALCSCGLIQQFLFSAGCSITLSLCPLRNLGPVTAPFCDLTSLPGTPPAGNGSPAFPGGFVPYTDAQSFNAQPFNLVLTPK